MKIQIKNHQTILTNKSNKIRKIPTKSDKIKVVLVMNQMIRTDFKDFQTLSRIDPVKVNQNQELAR